MVLALEELPAGHGDHARADALRRAAPRGPRAPAPPRCRWRSGSPPACPASAVGQHVGAAAQARGRGVLGAVEGRHAWRVSTSATGWWRRSMLTRQASATSLASAGRNTSRPGIARSEASCSTGWWVGPSSPSADRVVGEDVDHRQLHQRREPDRRPRVVGEDQEGRPSGRSLESARPLRSPPMACSRMPKWKLRPP